jgi:polyhydroxyalkanoate synthesis regulator phasin
MVRAVWPNPRCFSPALALNEGATWIRLRQRNVHKTEEVTKMSAIKNIVYLGVGMASATREKLEEVVEDLVKRGEVASADRSKALEELQQRAQTTANDVRKIVDERVEAVGKKLRWIDDLRKVQGEVDTLKARVAEMEKAASKPTRKKTTKS